MGIAQGFGVGKVEFFPGTVASLITCILLYPMLKLSLGVKIIFIFVLALVGVYVSGYTESQIGEEDPSSIIIDEVVGQFITLMFLPHPSLFSVAVGFFLFRALDIFKPFPIGYVEKRLRGGLGIMMDDIVAGVIGGIVLLLVF